MLEEVDSGWILVGTIGTSCFLSEQQPGWGVGSSRASYKAALDAVAARTSTAGKRTPRRTRSSAGMEVPVA